VKGILEFDFARLSDPNGPRYSTPVSVAVCEECGHVELCSQMPRLLCDCYGALTPMRFEVFGTPAATCLTPIRAISTHEPHSSSALATRH